MGDDQKSRFQVTKTLKINIMKHSIKKYRTDDHFIIWNLYGCTFVLITME